MVYLLLSKEGERAMTVPGNSAQQSNSNSNSNSSSSSVSGNHHSNNKSSHNGSSSNNNNNNMSSNDRRSSTARGGSSSSENSSSMQTLANLRSNGIAHASQQVTLTCYIPPNRVGAVIGRRGATILHIQREAVKQSHGHTSSVRVSVMGSHATIDHSHNLTNDTTPNNNNNSNNDNDASSTGSVDGWTPVVIRGDPCGAFAAAKLLVPLLSSNSGEDMGEVMDDVVLDMPIHRSRHAAIIGRKGLTIATLSADHSVRIMVPHRTSVNEDTSNKQIHLVQLEGNLDHVQECCAHMLSIVCSNSNKNNKNEQTDTSNESKTSDTGNSKPKKMVDAAFTVPSHVNMSLTRIKQIAKSTNTAIRRRKKNNHNDASKQQQLMELTITGRSECVSKAVQQLERIVATAKQTNDDTTEESNKPPGDTSTDPNYESDNETGKTPTEDAKQHKTSSDGTTNRKNSSSIHNNSKRRNTRGGPGRGNSTNHVDNTDSNNSSRPKNNNPNKRGGGRGNKRGGRGGIDSTNNNTSRTDSHTNNNNVTKKTFVDSSSTNGNAAGN